MPSEEDKDFCKGCGAVIYWGTTERGKRYPQNPDGSNHFKKCSAADQFRPKPDKQSFDGDYGAFLRSSMPNGQLYFCMDDSNEHRLKLKKVKK